MLPLGAAMGLLHGATPGWTWVTTILLIDVAHVYATGFRVYFDRQEWFRRRWLYTLTPILSFIVGAGIYSESVTLFWSLLAYLAVFHFIRQQYGWVALYRAKEGDVGKLGKWIDCTAIYLATIYPLVYWHANLPREFWWFAEGDFVRIPSIIETVMMPVYWMSMAAYLLRSIGRGTFFGYWNPGKDIVVVSTVVCWYIGIISFNSDYAFTVTNVIIHGIPYMVLIYWYRWHRKPVPTNHAHSSGFGLTTRRIVLFLGVIWMFAYVEEMLWDQGLWRRHDWLFGWAGSWREISFGETWWFGPLLAVPQITHYVLDGFIWRRSQREGHSVQRGN